MSDGSKINDPTRIAAEFNSLFASFFSGSADTNYVTAPSLDIPSLSNFKVSTAQVASEIKKLFARKAHGPDGISARMLKLACPTIIPVLTKFYNNTLAAGCLPKAWKCANVVPVYKRGDKTNLCNYRPVSLTPIICKILEKIVVPQILDHCLGNGLLSSSSIALFLGDLATLHYYRQQRHGWDLWMQECLQWT